MRKFVTSIETNLNSFMYCFSVMFVAFSRHLVSENGPHIDRLNMDGRGGRTHVVETGLDGPFISLFYDQELHRIFWTDPTNQDISSAAVDGKNTAHQIQNLFPIVFMKLNVSAHIQHIPNLCTLVRH
jgi:hypothetical protein